MNTLQAVLTAAAAAFDPDLPAHDWRCIAHDRDCPRPNDAWRDFFERVIVPIRASRGRSDPGWDSFAGYLAEASARCRPVTDDDARRGLGIFSDSAAQLLAVYATLGLRPPGDRW